MYIYQHRWLDTNCTLRLRSDISRDIVRDISKFMSSIYIQLKLILWHWGKEVYRKLWIVHARFSLFETAWHDVLVIRKLCFSTPTFSTAGVVHNIHKAFIPFLHPTKTTCVALGNSPRPLINTKHDHKFEFNININYFIARFVCSKSSHFVFFVCGELRTSKSKCFPEERGAIL